MSPLDPASEHARSSVHRDAVLQADAVGCFYCLAIYSPSEIEEWVDENDDAVGQTALCARCGIDAVIPVRPGVDGQFLETMKQHWFG